MQPRPPTREARLPGENPVRLAEPSLLASRRTRSGRHDNRDDRARRGWGGGRRRHSRRCGRFWHRARHGATEHLRFGWWRARARDHRRDADGGAPERECTFREGEPTRWNEPRVDHTKHEVAMGVVEIPHAHWLLLTTTNEDVGLRFGHASEVMHMGFACPAEEPFALHRHRVPVLGAGYRNGEVVTLHHRRVARAERLAAALSKKDERRMTTEASAEACACDPDERSALLAWTALRSGTEQRMGI